MLPAEVLNKWSQACKLIDIQWYLYKETLLCANGLHSFPSELPYAQVAVLAKDLPSIHEFVFRLLPKDWVLEDHTLASSQRMLCFKSNEQIVLTIDVLYSVAGQEHMDSLNKNLEQIYAKASSKLKFFKLLLKLIGILFGYQSEDENRATSEKVKNSKKRKQALRTILELAKASDESLPFYCDCFTNNPGNLLNKTFFSETEMLPCGDASYPVFAGYRNYLEMVYGDYENGLTDEIGVGLTGEEKEALKFHQARCKEALAFLQELSREFNLRYYLIAGSVLGPMRHGGFIPWDDDVDVGIRVEEIEHFEKIVKEYLPKRLPAGFTLEQSGANNPYPRMFSKICYEGRCCIDLWPLVPTYIHGRKARFTWYFAKLITKVHYYKIGHPVTKYKKLVKLVSMFLNDRQVMWLARRNERRYIGKNVPAYINLYSIYKRNKETIKAEWLDTPATLTFDGLEVPVVGCTKLYLTHMYGNYMGMPAPWKRASRHVARFHTSEHA